MLVARERKVSVFVLCLFVTYIFLYEWVVFEIPLLLPFVNILKLCIPVLLLFFSLRSFYLDSSLKVYFFLWVCFFGWALIPSLLSDVPEECITQWLKFSFLLLFIFSCVILFGKKNEYLIRIFRILVWIAFLTFLQFVCLWFLFLIGRQGTPIIIPEARFLLYGPFGLLGNQIASMYVAGYADRILRLTGFWVEPSKTAGYMFACFFLAKALSVYYEKEKIWRFISYFCLTGGVLCFSNAGYFSYGAAIFLACFLKSNIKSRATIFILLFGFSIILCGLLGRYFVSHHYLDSPFLRALFGVRGSFSSDGAGYNDLDAAMGGRINLSLQNFSLMLNNFFGTGLRIPGSNNAGQGFLMASASAPILWFAFTGYPGLLLLLIIECYVFFLARRNFLDKFQIYIVQAWLVETCQQLSYGTWSTPLYFILSIAVIVFCAKGKYR